MSVPFREHKGRKKISQLLWQRVRARAGKCRQSHQQSRLLRALWTHHLRRSLILTSLAGRPTSCNICKMLWWRPCGSISLLGLSTNLLMLLNWICQYVSVTFCSVFCSQKALCWWDQFSDQWIRMVRLLLGISLNGLKTHWIRTWCLSELERCRSLKEETGSHLRACRQAFLEQL